MKIVLGKAILFSTSFGFWAFCWFVVFLTHLKGYFDKGSVCKLSFFCWNPTELPLFIKIMSSITQIYYERKDRPFPFWGLDFIYNSMVPAVLY